MLVERGGEYLRDAANNVQRRVDGCELEDRTHAFLGAPISHYSSAGGNAAGIFQFVRLNSVKRIIRSFNRQFWSLSN
jgi:hypothetical protein